MTDLWVDGGDHGQGYLEHSLVPVDPLEVGEWSVRRDLAVRWGRMVGSDAEVKVTELYLPMLKHWNPLRERDREGERGWGREREVGGGRVFFAVNRPSSHRQSCIYSRVLTVQPTKAGSWMRGSPGRGFWQEIW